MIERDYIMRLINTLTRVLTRVLFHKKAFEYPQARRELDGAYTTLFGMSGDLLYQFSDEQLVHMFGTDEETVAAKCYVLGSLMKEEAEIRKLEEDDVNSVRLFLRALSLLLTSFLVLKKEAGPNHGEQIEVLCAELAQTGMSVSMQEKIHSYHELKRVRA